MSDDISIRKGETLDINIVIDDITSSYVKLVVGDEHETLFEAQANFVVEGDESIANIVVTDTDYRVGEYSYMFVIVYDDGTIEKLPAGDCDDCDDCELPKFIICKSLIDGVS